MNYYGSIKEFSDQVAILNGSLITNNKLYFIKNNTVYLIDENRDINTFYHKKGAKPYCIVTDGLWVKQKIDDEEYFQHIDILDLKKSYKAFPCSNSVGDFIGEFYIKQENRGIDETLTIRNLTTNETFSIKKDKHYSLTSDNGLVFALTSYGELFCYNSKLETVWSSKVEKERWSNEFLGIHKNLVIANRGANGKKYKYTNASLYKKEGLITAIKKTNGEMSWEYIFPEGEGNIRLIRDKVFAAQGARMFVLDAKTGDCLVNEPTGFEKSHTGDTLWTDGNALFFVNFIEAKIGIFSLDGKTLQQQLTIPEPYVPYENVTFEESYGRKYLSLATKGMALAGVMYGLLCLEPVQEGRELSIAVEERPFIEVLTLVNNEGEEYYHVIVIADNLDDVLRFGAITLKEYAQVRGAIVWEDGKRNKKFNGIIHFSTELERYGEEAEKKVLRMIEEVNHFAEYMNISAGNGKDDIIVSMVPLPDGMNI